MTLLSTRPSRPRQIPKLPVSAVLTMAIAFMASGCASDKEPGDASATAAGVTRFESSVAPARRGLKPATLTSVAGIINQDYRLTRLTMDAKPLRLSGVGRAITLRFTAPGRIAGQSAVNRYFGTFRLQDDGTLQWPNAAIGMTRMAGSETAMALENQFVRALTSTSDLKIGSDRVRFQNADESMVVEFAR